MSDKSVFSILHYAPQSVPVNEIFGLKRSIDEGLEPTAKKIASMVKEGQGPLSEILRTFLGKGVRGLGGLVGPILSGAEALRFGADIGSRAVNTIAGLPSHAVAKSGLGQPSMGIMPALSRESMTRSL